MKKLRYAVLGVVLFATAAYASMIVHGQLVDAALENLSSDPTAHTGRVYFNTSTNAAKVYNGTAWSGLGGAGAGEKNYLSAGASTNTGWTASGAGVTCTTPTTNLPDPSVGTALGVTGASGSTAFCYASFTTDDADFNKKMKLAWDQFPVSGYAASDMRVDVCECATAWSGGACNSGTVAQGCGTNATRAALSTDVSAVSALPALTGTYRTTYDSPGSGLKYIQVQVGLNGSNTHQLNLAQVVAGPGVVTQGAAVSDWISWTPTGTWTANTTYTGRYRRVGSQMEGQVSVAVSGGAPTTATLTVNMPAGFTINTSALAPGTLDINKVNLGYGFTGAADGYVVVVGYSSTTVLQPLYEKVATTPISNAIITQAQPKTYGTGDFVNFTFSVPIVEWAGSGTVNVLSNDYLYGSSDGTTTHCGLSNGDAVPTTTPSGTKSDYDLTSCFNTQSPNSIVLEYQVAGGSNAWTPSGGTQILSTCNFDGTNTIGACVRGTGGSIQLTQGKYPNSNGTSTPWSSATTASTRWRAKQYTGTGAVGFANVTQTGAGLVTSAGQLLGTNTNDSANAGNVGESFYDTIAAGSAVNYTATGTYKSVDSFTLTAGEFDISFVACWIQGTMVSTEVACGITTAVNASNGVVKGDNWVETPTAATAAADLCLTVPAWRTRLSGSQTYYSSCTATCSANCTNAKLYGRMSARRVR